MVSRDTNSLQNQANDFLVTGGSPSIGGATSLDFLNATAAIRHCGKSQPNATGTALPLAIGLFSDGTIVGGTTWGAASFAAFVNVPH